MRTQAFVPALMLLAAASTAAAQTQAPAPFGGAAAAQPAPATNGEVGPQLPATRESEAPMNDAEAAWAHREQRLGESSTNEGSVGLLHTRHAQGGLPGQWRLQLMTEYFSAGFLCSPAYPCALPGGGQDTGTNDETSHTGGRVSVGFGITKWLEGTVMISAYANSNPLNRPALLQVLGDSALGLKAFGGLSRVLYLGGGVDMLLTNGTGAVGLDGGGTGARFHGLGTLDFRGTEKRTPLRLSTNLTYMLDNTAEVVAQTEANRGQPINRIERYGLGINRVDQFAIKLGGEVFLAEERFRPFAEFGVYVPINRQGYVCDPAKNTNGDGCLALDPIAPSRLTLGVRWLPWKRGVSFTGAFDIGTSGVSSYIAEVAPMAPWTLHLGAGWAIDVAEKPPVERVKMIEKVVQTKKPKGKITGLVHESVGLDGKGAGAPIPQAIVSWSNHPELTAMATGSDGRFLTSELDPGDYMFSVKADGYKPGECGVKVAVDAVAQVDCGMESLPRVGVVVGHLKDEKGDSVGAAVVKLRTGNGKDLQLNTDATGGFRFTEVSPGTAQMSVDADNFLAFVTSLDVKSRQDNSVEIVLHRRPKNALVAVGKTEITIKQQIQFELNSAVILPASTPLMEEIADVFIKTPRIKRVEVQGHTDNTGPTERNRVLSDDRSGAVRTWLVAHGVSPDRLVAKGFGDTKPLVPNVTAGNRAKNRRVQFVILEQDASSPEDLAKKPQKTAPAASKNPKSDKLPGLPFPP
jgi:OmpA-OmpF porin, OOP family